MMNVDNIDLKFLGILSNCNLLLIMQLIYIYCSTQIAIMRKVEKILDLMLI